MKSASNNPNMYADEVSLANKYQDRALKAEAELSRLRADLEAATTRITDRQTVIDQHNETIAGLEAAMVVRWEKNKALEAENAGLRKDKDARQKAVMTWALESFGPIAANRDERAARLVEEAIEVAQAEGLNAAIIQRILDRVYANPPGELFQEIGGLAITLDALAQNCGLSVHSEAEREYARITSKPKDWWKQKHAAKVVAGTADLTPIDAALNAGETGGST